MTYTANIKWKCPCGNVNTDQLWTTLADNCGEEYENGDVPNDCDLNFIEPCGKCQSYELGDHSHENTNEKLTFPLVKM